MCPKTENFLAGDGQWDEEVKKALEDEFPTMEIRLLKQMATELTALAGCFVLAKGGDEVFKQALENACLIIKKEGFELLEQRFYRMLTTEQGEEFWRIWPWIQKSIAVLTETKILSEHTEGIRALQSACQEKLLNLDKRFNTFYNNKSHS